MSALIAPTAVRAQESPPGCQDSAVSVGINPSPAGPVQHGTQICYTVCYGAQGAALPCDIVNFDSSLVLPNGVTRTVTTNATINANTSFCCPSADPRCVLTSPNNCYVVDHDDEVTSFNGCPPVPSGDSGRVVAHTFGTGDTLTQLGDAVAPCATANNIVAHGSCCEPCTGVCTPVVTCNECPGDSIFTPNGDCSSSCLLTCGDTDACTTDGVCIPGSGRDNCDGTPPGTPATCGPNVHFCDDPPPAFTCDDANVCTTDTCLDDADPNNPCCSNVPIVCPPVPCMRNTGCNPVTGCQYVFDCRQPAAPGGTCCPDDGNPCTTETCDPTTGLCGATPDCTTALDCDDLDTCTADTCENSCCVHREIPCPALICQRNTDCDPILGCLYVGDCRNGPLGTCCPDDGNVCTSEFCDAATGLCGSTPDCTTASDCNDNDVCTSDACVNSCCVHEDISCPALVCQRNTDCDPIVGCEYVGDCRNGPLGTCCPDDGNPCTAEFCDAATGLCGFTPDCTSAADCDDQNLCTVDSCENSCCVHRPFVCPEIPCRRLTGCDPTAGCQYVDDCRTGPLGTCCPPDANPCTEATCNATTGLCESQPDCVSAADCNDQSLCTDDTCEGSCCIHTPITCTPALCERSTGCNPATGCTFEDVTPCCGNNIVETGETCDPPGSMLPDGSICSEICRRCGDGILDDGEECEVGIECFSHDKPCKNTVCNDQCKCIKVPLPNGTIVPTDEECLDLICQNGMPSDLPKPNGAACGSAVPEGVCDTADSCDGKGHCNLNYKEAYVECRPAVDVCDRAETCSGLNPGCPPNTFALAGTLAPDDGAECTYDVCNGQGVTLHPPKARGTLCGNQIPGICDLPDSCDGAGVCDMNLVVTANNCPVARLAKFSECMRGPGLSYPNPSCFTVDLDQDNDVDHEDCSLMME